MDFRVCLYFSNYPRDSAFSKKQLNELRSQLEQYYYISAYCNIVNERSKTARKETAPTVETEEPRNATMWQLDLKHMYNTSRANPDSIYHGIYNIKTTPAVLQMTDRAVMGVEMYVELEKTGFKIELDSEEMKKEREEKKKRKTVKRLGQGIGIRSFTAAEDMILFTGISIYGFDEPESIHAFCLYVMSCLFVGQLRRGSSCMIGFDT
jgi:hypothetical protein